MFYNQEGSGVEVSRPTRPPRGSVSHETNIPKGRPLIFPGQQGGEHDSRDHGKFFLSDWSASVQSQIMVRTARILRLGVSFVTEKTDICLIGRKYRTESW